MVHAPVKVLFIARHFTYFRNFDSVVESLAARGHAVHLAADREEAQGGRVEARSELGKGSTFAAVLPRIMTLPEGRPEEDRA